MAEKNKRTAWTVQDVINGKNDDTGTLPKFKSGYSGPKKSTASVMQKYNISSQKGGPAQNPAGPSARRAVGTVRRSGGIMDYAWVAFSAVILLCVVSAISIYSIKGTSHDGIYYPTRVPTIGGIVKDIMEEYYMGGLGSKHAAQGAQKADEMLENTENAQSDAAEPNQDMLGNQQDSATTPNTTVGATMALDTGGDYGDYKSALSYEELLSQIDKALSANDFGFVGTKLSYTEEEGGPLIGYPQSVVEHFTQYMFDNPSKKESFLAEIKDADTFMAKNASAFVVKLPRVQFTVNMGYDDATLSISGFTDTQMNSGEKAVVSPLLPCMYTIHVSTPGGSKTSEVECDMSEGDLAVNIGVTQ